MQPTLTTQRLTLRPFTQADAKEVQRLAGDARVAATTTTIPHPYPDDAAEAWIATHEGLYQARTELVFAVTLRASGTLVGAASLLDVSEAHARAELGYWIAVEHWSSGYGTEAAGRLIQFAHEALAITRVVARCMARNKASAAVMEKCGLQREGHLVRHVLKNGQYEDILLYGLVLPGRESAGTTPAPRPTQDADPA
ncbi:MAG TPA: GNAT family N-acetyltransferase [Ideonella sp.]|nr:GNAT family N-acetyltransferase [Ideonella sp.]